MLRFSLLVIVFSCSYSNQPPSRVQDRFRIELQLRESRLDGKSVIALAYASNDEGKHIYLLYVVALLYKRPKPLVRHRPFPKSITTFSDIVLVFMIDIY
jgi:hypothetical protein